MPYPASAATIPIIPISMPLLIQFPTVSLAFMDPMMNRAIIDRATEVSIAFANPRNMNGTKGKKEPKSDAIPTVIPLSAGLS